MKFRLELTEKFIASVHGTMTAEAIASYASLGFSRVTPPPDWNLGDVLEGEPEKEFASLEEFAAFAEEFGPVIVWPKADDEPLPRLEIYNGYRE